MNTTEHYGENADHEAHDLHKIANKLAARIEEENFHCSEDFLQNAHIELTAEHWVHAIELLLERQGGFVGQTEDTYYAKLNELLMARAQYCLDDSAAIQDIIDAERTRITALPGAASIDLERVAQDVWARYAERIGGE